MNIIKFEKLKSTNDYAKEKLASLSDKTIIIAEHQNSGRGQFDRKWIDISGENIFMTIVLKPNRKFEEKYSDMTRYLSVKVCQLLEKYGINPSIKYPNDILISGKKVSGILAEAVTQGEIFKGMVLGIGINVNVKAEDLQEIDIPITSLSAEIGQKIDKEEFIEKLLESFFKDYELFLAEGFLCIEGDYVRLLR
jgi:BirA family transcriptional regulator, biotin operon repressor / biotin---[acetyl-CoA-carboxylase] ligase